MKSRAIVFALAAIALSMSSGCHCLHQCFPNIGWRLHQCGPAPCAPACGPVCPAPCGPCSPAFRPPMVVPGGPDCPGCATGPMMPPPGAFAPGAAPPGMYPPIIGNPIPLPGQPGGTQLHNPTMVPPKTGGN